MPTLDEHAQEGIKAISEKRIADAIEHFTHALEVAPDRPDMNNALGMAYLHRGEVVTAIPHLKKAVELSESFDDTQYADLKVHFFTGLASAYQLMDDVDNAARVLRETAKRWPEALEPRLQLGQVLLSSCRVEEGLDVYRALADEDSLDEERTNAALALTESIQAFLDSEEEASVFLEAHQGSYVEYFNAVAAEQEGWYTEATRMSKDKEGNMKPILPEGARPYAMSRVDLVNPEDSTAASVYSDTEPMIVGVEGLEPLAQIPVMLPWSGFPFEVWVSTNCPWHWLTITIQLYEAPERLDIAVEKIDASIADWYLAGFNGDYGEKDTGRFHYITDPDTIGDRAITYTVDLGRAKYEAVEGLLRRMRVIHERMYPVQRVLFGMGHLPD